MRKPHGMVFSFALAVVIICAATAIICGGLILLTNLGGFGTSSKAAEFYAVGKKYDSIGDANGQADLERSQGRAGYVLAADDSFLLVYALYAAESDAIIVADRLQCDYLPLQIKAVSFAGEDKELCAEGMDTLCEVVAETEKIWRQLDAAETSESLSVKILKSYAEAVGNYAAASDGVGGLCSEIKTLLTTAAKGSKYPLTADIKHFSAETAARLAEFSAK